MTRAQRRDRTTLVSFAVMTVALVALGLVVPRLQPDLIRRTLNPPQPIGTPPNVSGTGEYAFLGHQPGKPDEPVAYDPCRSIEVEVNPAGGPNRSVALVRAAMDRISDATGLRLVYAGTTTRRPAFQKDSSSRAVPASREEDEKVLVAWSDDEETPSLAGTVAGMGGSIALQDRSGFRSYVSGQIALDTEAFDQLAHQRDARRKELAIVMHEFGHVVGLDHVHDASQLMYPQPTALGFGTGDRLGLAELGSGRCR